MKTAFFQISRCEIVAINPHIRQQFFTKATFMKRYALYAIIPSLAIASFMPLSKSNPTTHSSSSNHSGTTVRPTARIKARIQAAILLDVSSSMDGLINQAKLQLWDMVNVMSRGRCDGAAPEIEIALYEYGRSSNNRDKGYIKQLSPFTTNLDSLSSVLFGLTTNGGLEYCGQVIYTALNELNWDESHSTYKVIFIAGNEDFLQGTVHYQSACNVAKEKSVIVNTIYCGPREQGIREHWDLNDDCGSGGYTHINQDAQIEEPPTPYDDILFSKNSELNKTYLRYGTQGAASEKMLAQTDLNMINTNKSAALARAEVKATKSVYNNAGWDLVDAYDRDHSILDKIDKQELADSLKEKDKAEIIRMIKQKMALREHLRSEIIQLSSKRQEFLKTEREKNKRNEVQTLQSEIEKMIKKQAKDFNIIID